MNDETICPICKKNSKLKSMDMCLICKQKQKIENSCSFNDESKNNEDRSLIHKPKQKTENSYSYNSELKTAKDMYNYAVKNNFGKGFTDKWGIKHFEVILNVLNNDENVELCGAMSYHAGNSDKSISGTVAIVLTNKRLIIGQKKVIGEHVISISLKNINDIYFEKKALFGYITIDTNKEKISIYSDNKSAKNFYNVIQTLVEGKKNIANNDKNDDDKYEKLKKLKTLLDEDIITKDEFDKEKAKILQ